MLWRPWYMPLFSVSRHHANDKSPQSVWIASHADYVLRGWKLLESISATLQFWEPRCHCQHGVRFV
jgi:hypothetical protein